MVHRKHPTAAAGDPLLTSEEDFLRVADALVEASGDDDPIVDGGEGFPWHCSDGTFL